MKNIIEVKELEKSFNGKPVLQGLSFELKENENIVIMAKSGGGKSVLLKIIVGLIDPDNGEVKVNGRDVSKMNEDELIRLRKKVGYIFQEGALYDSITVGENISFSLEREIPPKTRSEIKAITKETLEKVKLLDAINKMPDELSGGMRKRIAIARTLAMQPDIILYDEPTAGLDPATAKEIISLIMEMKKTLGISSIIATHDLICAQMTADRILLINNGKIEAEGSFESLEKSENKWVKSFFQ